jgi:uncharacterized protein (TIGR03435 family)
MKGTIRTMATRILSLRQCNKKLLLFASGSMLAMPAMGQTNAAAPPDAGGRKFTYDVVSVKPSKPGNGMWWKSTKDGFSTGNAAVRSLLMNAYGVMMMDQIAGLPGWADSDTFDVEAKMDEETVAALEKLPKKEQSHEKDLMLQELLADRFKLKVHHETKELPVYALAIAKGGLKIKESQDAAGAGLTMRMGQNGGWQIDGHGMAIESLTMSLTNEVGRLIVDKTGLTGKYDITLKWTPDSQQGTADSGPSIFAALEEQLGLKLESTKGPVDTIVVDHVEKPQAN